MAVAHLASRTGLARTVTAGIVGLALLQAGPASAQRSSVDFTVSGTSTVRGWTCLGEWLGPGHSRLGHPGTWAGRWSPGGHAQRAGRRFQLS